MSIRRKEDEKSKRDFRSRLPRYAGFSLTGVLIAVLIGVAIILAIGQSGIIDLASLLPRPGATATPTPTPTPTRIPVSIQGVRQLAELATVEYWTVGEVRNENVPDDLRQHLGVKEEMLLLVYVKVKAGFDLSKVSDEDIWTDGSRVQLHLPAPEVLSAEIDLDRTHIVYYRNTLLSRPDPDLERQAMKQAKEAVIRALEESGGATATGAGSDTGDQPFAVDESYMAKARQYGQVFFENYLRSMGFTDVRVIVD
jgi:hypothetical protein